MLSARSSRWLLLAVLAVAASTSGCDLAASTQDAKTAVGAGDAASDLGTQSSLRDALTAANVVFTETSSYDGIDATTLAGVEPGFCFVGPTTPSVSSGGSCEAGGGSQPISVFGAGQTFAAAAMSSTGTCFWIRATGGSLVGLSPGEPCTGSAAVGASGPPVQR